MVVKAIMYLLTCLMNTLTSVTYKTTPSINIHINVTKNMYCNIIDIVMHRDWRGREGGREGGREREVQNELK